MDKDYKYPIDRIEDIAADHILAAMGGIAGERPQAICLQVGCDSETVRA